MGSLPSPVAHEEHEVFYLLFNGLMSWVWKKVYAADARKLSASEIEKKIASWKDLEKDAKDIQTQQQGFEKLGPGVADTKKLKDARKALVNIAQAISIYSAELNKKKNEAKKSEKKEGEGDKK